MAKYAILDENNVVANIIEAEPEIADEQFPDAIFYTDEAPAGIGWTYDGKKFIEPTTESNTDTVE